MQNRMVFCVGPAGTGKTHVSLEAAAYLLLKNAIREIVVIRSPIEAGEKIGFLPGDINEKIDPYFAAVLVILNRILGRGYVDCAVRKGNIRMEPFAFLRSGTIDHSFVLIEEAQNSTISQMKLALTRIGNNTRYCIAGDDRDQTDLPVGVTSGLTHAVHLFHGVPNTQIIKYDIDDIVRDDMCKVIVKSYRSEQARKMNLSLVS